MMQPNYECCASMEYWGFNTAALILSDICPIKYRSVRLVEGDIPEGFEKAREICYILKSIPWSDLYKDYYFKGKGIRSSAVIAIAKSKKINIHPELLNFMELHYKAELAQLNELLTTKNKNSNNEDKELSSRERKSWQLGLGLLTRLYANKIGKLCDDQVKMSASQLHMLLLDEAEKIGMSSDGLKSFDRKITQSLELIASESDL